MFVKNSYIADFYHVVCDVTLSVYPHRTSLKNMPGHGGNRTYDLWNACVIVRTVYVYVTSLRVLFSAFARTDKSKGS